MPKMGGFSYVYDEDGTTITEAAVTESHISIDWVDNVGNGHLVADSEDDNFDGTYGYKTPDGRILPHAIRHFEFKRFTSGDGDVLLLGQWWEDGGEGAPWLIHLIPVDALALLKAETK